jgi:hypothetical protein
MVDGAEGSTAGSEDGLPSPRHRQQQEEGSDYLKYVPGSYRGRLPSVEALFTLAWMCEVEMKKQRKQAGVKSSAVKAGLKRRSNNLSGLMKPHYPTWEPEQRFSLDPKSRLAE